MTRMPNDTVAKRIVHDSLRVHEDDMVLIETWHHTLDVASDIALECYKMGAKPMITLMTDRLWWNILGQIPDQYIRKTPKHVLSAADTTTVWILLGGPQDPAGFTDVPASRLESYFEGEKPVLDKTFEKKVRTAAVLLGHITPQRATTYGFNYERWLKMTDDAIKADYQKMTELGRKIAIRLERGKRVHITSKTGTDMRFEISKRPVHIQDGIVDQNDISRGLVSTQLPSGKVETAPLEDSAHGKLVFDVPRALKGRMVRGLSLRFEKGKVVEYHAEKSEEVFREVLEATSGDKENIAQFAIGLNPRVELIGYATDELALGTATVGLGANRGIGGRNYSSFSFSGTIAKPTIEVNGHLIMSDGKISL